MMLLGRIVKKGALRLFFSCRLETNPGSIPPENGFLNVLKRAM